MDGGGHSRGAADIQGNFMSDTDQIHAPHTIKAGKEEKKNMLYLFQDLFPLVNLFLIQRMKGRIT